MAVFLASSAEPLIYERAPKVLQEAALVELEDRRVSLELYSQEGQEERVVESEEQPTSEYTLRKTQQLMEQ